MNRKLLWAIAMVAVMLCRPVWANTEWSAQDYDLYPGDFDGDGKTDLLYIAKDPGKPSGIARSDGTAPNIPFQSWASNYLGIPWYGNNYVIVVADFNHDNRADVFLQRKGAGDHYLLLANSDGKLVSIAQTIANNSYGVVWAADQHRLVPGDFNGDGYVDLFLQATSPGGLNAVMLVNTSGTFQSAPAQSWNDSPSPGGFKWSTQDAIVYAGDFNGDGSSDLLVQAKPQWVIVDYDVSIPVPSYPPNLSGLVLAQNSSTIFATANANAWSHVAYGADWSTLRTNLVVADFNGDGRSDVLLQSKNAASASYLALADGTPNRFAAASTISANVGLSGDAARLLAGKFSGSSGSGLYIQALNASGTNSIANSVGTSISATAHDPTSVTGALPVGAVGRTMGTFSVSNAGSATYAIPIAVPPGVAGLQPAISITYQSGRGNGPLGVGWGLSGFSAIARCKKTLVQDNSNNAPAWLPGDAYCIDGARMRKTSGTEGANGATYQTELEQFSRITVVGASGTGPDHFVVEGKDGLIYTYGNSSTSRDDISNPSEWLVNRIQDRSGNYMTIQYVNDQETFDIRPYIISYTANDAAGLAPSYSVQFNWDLRPTSDLTTRTRVGGTSRGIYRLGSIETQYLDPALGSFRLVRKYYLRYNTSGSSPRSRLQTVQECDRNNTCMPATVVTWQDGQAGLLADQTAANLGSLGQNAMPIDLNGDGRTDVIYPDTSNWAYMLANSAGGYDPPVVSTTAHNGNYLTALPIDYNADGKMELLVQDTSSNWKVLTFNGTGFTVSNPGTANIPAPAAGGRSWVADVNGDGYQDLVFADPNATQLKWRANSASGLSTTPAVLYTAPSGSTIVTSATFGLGSYYARSITSQADFNADGRTDFMLATTASGVGTPRVLISTGTAYVDSGLVISDSYSGGSSQVLTTWQALDANADGVTDLAFVDSSGVWKVAYGRAGTPVFAGVVDSTIGSVATAGNAAVIPFDWDGDGRTDVLSAVLNFSGPWQVSRSTGEVKTLVLGGVGSRTAFQNTQILTNQSKTAVVDVNGDGQGDLAYVDSSNNWHYLLHKGPAPDLVRSVTDGFGNIVSVDYAPLTDSAVYTKTGTATFPAVVTQMPVNVVKQYTASDGVGGSYVVTEHYSGAQMHLQGRGFLGFASRVETDTRTGIQTTWTYRQDFPFVGAPTRMLVTQPGGTPISDTTYSYGVLALDTTPFNQRSFPYVSQTVEKTYEVGGTANGQQIRQVTTTNGFDSFGNQNDIDVVTRDSTTGAQFENHKVAQFTSDVTNWCISLKTTEDEYRYLPDGSNGHRVISHTPDSAMAKCRITRHTIEPSDAVWRVNTDYAYDAFGNVNRETVSATGIVDRVTTTSYGPKGVFPVSVTNPASEVTGRTYDYALGVPLSATDASGIAVQWQYDGFGRAIQESHADGTATTWTIFVCNIGNGYCGDSQLRYQILQRQLDSGAGVIRTALQRFDSMARVRYDETQTISGASSVVRTDFDNQQRVQRKSEPYFAGAMPYFTATTYDLIGRPVTEKRPVDSSDAASSFPYCVACRTTQYTYTKLSRSVTDPNNNTTTQITNAINQIVQMVDPATGNTSYTFDPFGNTLTVKDPANNTIASTYNVRGFRMTSSDPDMGNWTYNYYATGELQKQTDANLHDVTYTYDGMSRALTRVEPEGTTTWTYGSSATAHNVGKLQSVSSPGGYSEARTYDSLGRTQDVTTTIDGTQYVVSSAYSATTGYPDTTTYPTSTSATPGSRFKVQYSYAYGILQAVKNYNTPTTVYWQQVASDASGRAVDAQFGNALHTYSTYDLATGRLINRFTGASSQIQNLAYDWDKVGNLTERRDLALSLTEHFYYDNLQRLDYSTLKVGAAAPATNADLSYNAVGNITSKLGAGTYDYTTSQSGCSYYAYSQPHAVRHIGSAVYCYDANGNMTRRQGDTIAWTSFDLPSQISKGTNSAQFFYDAARGRYKQVSVTNTGPLPTGTETTVYIGGLFEKITKPSGIVEYKHYIAAGREAVAIRTLRSNGSNDTKYLHKDHLGGIDTITDDLGNVAAKLSFDALGNRRDPSAWSGTPGAANWTSIAAISHRGFTSHEGLDNVGLIHMNGRVYDPSIGRFISSDPTVPAPLLSQSLNRYSYVMNNPLSLVDPSGYSFSGTVLGALWEGITGFVKTFGPLVVSVYTGDLAYTWAGGGLWGAVAGGAVGGLTFNTLTVAFNGGTLSQVLSSGLHGAATGAITGAVTYGLLRAVQFVASEVYVRSSIRGGVLYAQATPTPPPMDEVVVIGHRTLREQVAFYLAMIDFDGFRHWSGWAKIWYDIKCTVTCDMPGSGDFDSFAASFGPVVGFVGDEVALAARGGAAVVRMGQAGEAAVRGAFDIGQAMRITVNGATRIPDGLTSSVLSEVKNVGSLSYTQQLRDFAQFASENRLRFDLYVRPTTQLSGPLEEAVTAGTINLRYIPGL